MRRALLAFLPVMLIGGGCSAAESAAPQVAPSSTTVASVPSVEPTPTSVPPPVEIRLRLDRRVSDAATEGFDAIVRATLSDPQGWIGAGFAFTFADDAPYVVVLAEAGDVDSLCAPYRTRGQYSCQNGPVVALNADRWRSATPEWTGDLASYREMLVNHEVGHLLGQHHPAVQCPQPGAAAPVMAQQSTELDGCLPNPWPLDWELVCAARHEEPLAPGYEVDAAPSCSG